MPASPARRRSVSLGQTMTLLAGFVVLSMVGGILMAGLVLPAVAATGQVTDTAVEFFDDLPTALEPQELPQQSNMYASDGSLLATFWWQNRVVVPLEQISENIQTAVVAIEDRRFYEHGGVDAEGLARAVVVMLTSDDMQGASTLTQQYVKNLLVEEANSRGDTEAVEAAREPTLKRKIREAKLAIALEQRMTKEDILEGYLNIAQFGPSVYGVESASQYYFGKAAADLTMIEAATLAGITQNPARWDPVRNPRNAESRRNVVLATMRDQDIITAAEYQQMRDTPIEDTLNVHRLSNGCQSAGDSAYFCDYVTKVIINDPVFGETAEDRQNLLYRGGLEIYTTLDPNLQAIAIEELEATLPRDDPSGRATAMSVVEPGTGRIFAMAQNRTYTPGETTSASETMVNYNTDKDYGSSGGFQAGSTFKPFVLATWLRSGKALNQVVNASSRQWTGDQWTASCIGANPLFFSGTWSPGNSDGQGRGPMTVLSATARSINTAYVSMASQLDLCDMVETAKSLGFHLPDGNDVQVLPSTALGAQNVAPLTQAASYAAFAANGVYCDPVAITRMLDANGNELQVPDADCRQVIEEPVAAAVTYALTRVMTEGTGASVQLSGRPSAGKTGTTNANLQTWFIGFTPQLSTAVWLGNPDTELDTNLRNIWLNGRHYDYVWGSTLAAPTWDRFMTRALEGAEVLTFPEVSERMLYGELVRFPNVTGLDVESATSVLADAGFQTQVSETPTYSESVPAGMVASTSPAPGSRVVVGSWITLVLSQGPAPAEEEPDQEDPDGSTDPGDVATTSSQGTETGGRSQRETGDGRDQRGSGGQDRDRRGGNR